ncbi:MAG: hypothetical protein JXA33_03400 [Anaerolineae bacterium]|nr:hypothetical protein [Anaerolineae bacterium]
MLPDFEAYCNLIANLPNQSPYIQRSILSAYTISALTAEVEGQIIFGDHYVLDVWELLDLVTQTIYRYSYELRCGTEIIWWYDPQEHPNDPTLTSTHPHHKHVSPDIKHHRIPAPGISFEEPNLPFLIREVEKLL